MTPLARCVVANLAWRIGVQIPVFVLYRILDRPSKEH